MKILNVLNDDWSFYIGNDYENFYSLESQKQRKIDNEVYSIMNRHINVITNKYGRYKTNKYNKIQGY